MGRQKKRPLSLFLKKHGWFLASFGFLFAYFFYPLLAGEAAFIGGDYGTQFYPWSVVYAEALRAGKLLLWTPLLQNGFSLFSEGQTGMLYPLHLLFYGILPVKIAYNAVLLAHFLLGGFFCYRFAAALGLSRAACAFTAVVFTFGSGYAGCFYNMVSMRSLVWFPLMLLCVERILEKGKWRWAGILALAVGNSALAGFPQTAAYSCFFALLYYVLRFNGQKGPGNRSRRAHLLFFAGGAVGVLLALPQLWATWEAAQNSSRVLQDRSFALWGSVPPWQYSTLLVYPWSLFLKSFLYIGVLPLALAFLGPRGPERCKVWWWLTGAGVFFALGAYNPLYWFLIHLPGAGLLRNPYKFTFFVLFGLTMLAGEKWDRLIKLHATALKNAAETLSKRLLWLALGTLTFTMSALLVAHAAGPLLRAGGAWYVRHFILNRSYHPYSLEHYLEKVEHILAVVQRDLSLMNAYFWVPWLLAGFFLVGLNHYAAGRLKKNHFLAGLFFVVVLDLGIYATAPYNPTFLANRLPWGTVSQALPLPKTLPSERWLDLGRNETATLAPNQNLLGRRAVPGVYAPLVDRSYYEVAAFLGMTDDSFGRTAFRPDRLKNSRPLLDFMGIRYLLDPAQKPPRAFLPRRADAFMFYENPDGLGEFSLVAKTRVLESAVERLRYLQSPAFDPRQEVVVEVPGLLPPAEPSPRFDFRVLSEAPSKTVLAVQTNRPVFLVRNQTFHAGWAVTQDGLQQPLRRVNHAFQGVAVNAGSHEIVFEFKPDFIIIGRWFTLGSLILIFGFLTVDFLERTRKS